MIDPASFFRLESMVDLSKSQEKPQSAPVMHGMQLCNPPVIGRQSQSWQWCRPKCILFDEPNPHQG